MLIQTTENYRPITFMYRMVHLETADESAPSLRDYLLNALKLDGIYDVVKSSLVGIVSGN